MCNNMSLFDLTIVFISAFQPIVIGYLSLLSIYNLVSYDFFFFSTQGSDISLLNSRVYECSTYSRLNNMFSYDINTISLLLAFLVYDVDFIFFFAETSVIFNLTILDFFIFLVFLVLFIFGILFDVKLGNLSWSF